MLFFCFFNRNVFRERRSKDWTTALFCGITRRGTRLEMDFMEFLLGGTAAAVACIFTNPLEVFRTPVPANAAIPARRFIQKVFPFC